MFGKKEKPRRQNRTADSLAQYGIFEVPKSLGDIGNDFAGDDDDDELEEELAALTASDDTGYKRRRKAPKKPIPDEHLDAMVAESMKDINLDEDVSGGEEDPDLLSELKMITGDGSPNKSSPEEEHTPESDVTEQSGEKEDNAPTEETIKLLQERLNIYQIAETKAKHDNEPGKARRYNRGIKTLKEQLKEAQAGKAISEDDIPPPLPPSATTESTPKPTEDNTTVADVDTMVPAQLDNDPPKVVDEQTLQLLKDRQQEYKLAALAWKKAGNVQEAVQHVKIAKQFDIVIAALNAGESVDLSDMPLSPALPAATVALPANTLPEKQESAVQQSPFAEPPVEEKQPTGPEDVETALKERLEIYRRTKTAAEGEGNSSKARRYGRICKQFEEALKLYARGKPVALDELPIPPGFPPLSAGPPDNAALPDVAKEGKQPEPAPQAPSDPDPPETKDEPSSTSPKIAPIARKRQNQKVTTRAEKQLAMLLQRQHELKQAAFNAKQDGDVELARDYLRQAKGIQPLIEASKGGLPVDMNSIPLSPIAKLELDAHGLSSRTDDSFTLVSTEDCLEEAGGTDEQIYENLEKQLIKQIKWCLHTRDHSKALGDVPGYNRWERLALGYTRDLDMLRVRKRDSLPPPQHHYETKTYAIVQSCTDLSDGDVEISIVRGINYSKEADTYVMFEFPYPSDNPPSDRTSTVKASSNPEYQSVFPLNGIIERSSRQCQRAFKRHALKCQVWAKGGFFRSDNLLGTVTVKLHPLETQCVLHDSFPLMEGRKATGGKLELKMRLRNPILTKQIEQITDKWLTIDQ